MPAAGNAPDVDAPLGVFDSGVGGLSILRALRAELPNEAFVYFADSGHAPYGERGDDFVVARSRAITRHLQTAYGIKALVIACNTATAAAVHLLRAEHPRLPIIGIEPALKPAIGHTRTGRIGVMATRGTLTSTKFRALLDSLSGLAEFVTQPCDGLAGAIERQDSTQIEALCARYTAAMGRFGHGPGEIDTLVLGCTHYAFAQATLRSLLGDAIPFIETGEPVARHTHQLLKTRKVPLRAAPNGPTHTPPLTLHGTGDPHALQSAARRWLQIDTAALAVDI